MKKIVLGTLLVATVSAFNAGAFARTESHGYASGDVMNSNARMRHGSKHMMMMKNKKMMKTGNGMHDRMSGGGMRKGMKMDGGMKGKM